MPTTTGHIGSNLTNLDCSSEFYADVFGLTSIGGSNQPSRRYAFLGDGETLVLTLWDQSEGRLAANTPGRHHLSFQVATIEEVSAAEQRLRQKNATFLYDGIVPHAEGRESGGIFFEDPDGTRLEIFTPSGAGNRKVPIDARKAPVAD